MQRERERAFSPTSRLVGGDSYFCYVSVKCKSKQLTEGCPAAKAVFSAAAAPCLWGGQEGSSPVSEKELGQEQKTWSCFSLNVQHGVHISQPVQD